MKFGSNLPRNQVPEWAANYINYKGLKKLIKNAAENAKQGQTVDTASFFFSLDRNLEDVDNFYNKKYADVARRLKLLQDQYGKSFQNLSEIDRDEAEDIVGALLDLRTTLRNLQWYGDVNRRGFVKITKKLDKKIPSHTERGYVEAKVDLKPFATNMSLAGFIQLTNEWLSKLGDIKMSDDNSDTLSSKSFARASSKAILRLPQSVLETLDQAIRSDDAPILIEVLQESNLAHGETDDTSYQKLLLNLLQRSISCRSRNCISKLLPQIKSLKEEDDINHRSCLHRFVITLSRSRQTDKEEKSTQSTLEESLSNGNYITPAAPPSLSVPSRTVKEVDGATKLGNNDKAVQLFVHILDQLNLSQRIALQYRDNYGRLPLHYAAQYGFVVIVQIILSRMQAWGISEANLPPDSSSMMDLEGLTPLHLSVIGGHPLTTKALLDADEWRKQHNTTISAQEPMKESGPILALATKLGFVEIIRLLVQAHVNLDYCDKGGETALHIAARAGQTECAKVLLAGSSGQKALAEVAESMYGWTPLFVACVEGHLPVVVVLIEAGADPNRLDYSGWTAKEHACLRGHIDIANLLALYTPPSPDSRVARSQSSKGRPSSTEKKAGNGNGYTKVTEPVKTFGHRYLTDDTMVMVSLGSMDLRKNVDAVNLDRIPFAEAHQTQLDTALSLVVSASGATGEPSLVDLPVQENISTEPMVFMTKDATKVKLLFDIIPTYAGNKDKIVGRGVALLSSIKPSIGSKRITLQGDVAVPIVSAHNLEVIGCVNFNFLIVTPFKHPKMSITEDHTYWKSMTSTMVIGHRGLGKNTASRTSLQLGENTVQSFIAAANLGASYVEFDVQLTKDHVPVIYHDFLVSETGIDAPVHTLTLEQFLHVNDNTSHRPSRATSPEPTLPLDPTIRTLKSKANGPDARKHRSMSVGTNIRADPEDMAERMKHTRDFKVKGFKANSRGNFIQAPFATLEDMFTKLPASIGFNIEMKYPMLAESEEHEMDTYAVELNSFVDSVLTKVYDLGAGRNIIFSSFNPDICLLLSFKQPSIPILFLTEAGTAPIGDVRASSLQEAIRFASRWNLLGLVSAAEPLVLCPRLVKVVKESGLVCVSYGSLNNDPANVKLQVQEGIDAVIVDSVLAIRKGLTGGEGETAKGDADELLVGGETNGGLNGSVNGKAEKNGFTDPVAAASNGTSALKVDG